MKYIKQLDSLRAIAVILSAFVMNKEAAQGLINAAFPVFYQIFQNQFLRYNAQTIAYQIRT